MAYENCVHHSYYYGLIVQNPMKLPNFFMSANTYVLFIFRSFIIIIYIDLVVNVSSYQLTADEIKVLSKGLKFIPTARNIALYYIYLYILSCIAI